MLPSKYPASAAEKFPGVVIAMSDEHGHAASGRKPNRLINEQSPYLRQHAYNPVDWYAWGDEALGRARAENKPSCSRSVTRRVIGAT